MTSRPRPMVPMTETVQRILATRYPGQVPAVVLERALRQMAARDQRRARQAAKR